MNWQPIATAPADGSAVLTDEGLACYVDPRAWGSPVTRGWQYCTPDGNLIETEGPTILAPRYWLDVPWGEVPK